MANPAPERTGLRVAVAVPSHDKIDALFAYDLGRMMAYMGHDTASPDGVVEELSLNFITGTYIESARQDFAWEALRQEADYVLWLDSDMRFPKDVFYRLLVHNKELVGVNYSTRGIPPKFVAIKTVGDEEGKIPLRCPTRPHNLAGIEASTGLEEVEAIGFGATLMRTSVLHRLHDPRGPEGPWFMNSWSAETKRRIGEDVYFCRLVRKAGGTVYVDHDLSQEISHMGQFEYRVHHAWEFFEGDLSEPSPEKQDEA